MYREVATAAVAAVAAYLTYQILPSHYLKHQFLLALAYIPAVVGVVQLLKMGLVNFGYAMYYMAGAYAAALVYKHWGVKEISILLPISLAGGLLLAILTAPAARTRGIFYALLNLAFSMIPYGLILKLYHITGGSDGITIIGLTLFGSRISLDTLALFLAVVTFVVLLWNFIYVNSSYEYVSWGIRDNEIRMSALGVNVEKFIFIVTLYSATLAALSGVLVAVITWHVTPEYGHWAKSGLFVLSGVAGLFMSRKYGFVLGPVLIVVATTLGTRLGYDIVLGLGFLALYIASYLRYVKS